MSLHRKAYCKVNLTLDIGSVREDGYHTLRSVMQQISLADDLWICPDDDISIVCNLPFIPTDERNIIRKAADHFFAYTGISGGAYFTLHKRVPAGAGLGGGSSDGAAAVMLLDELYQTHLTKGQMAQIVSPIGADIPFFLYGGTALCEGIGDIITPVTSLKQGALLLIKPSFSMSTPKIYQALDTLESYPHPDVDGCLRAIGNGDLRALGCALGNSMQSVADRDYPEIARLCTALKNQGALGAIMSGAGSTVFGLFESVQQAKAAALPLISNQYVCYVVTPITE